MKHKLTGEKMTIIKRYGQIVLCSIDPYYIGTMLIDRAVCNIKNLIQEEDQLTIFDCGA